MSKKSNVYRKSNIFPRQKGTTVWQDKIFLQKINDVALLAKYQDEFKNGDPGRSINYYFSEEQLELLPFSGTCAFAPKGVKTFGFTQGPNGKKVVVCRCPYASNDKQHLCKGVAQWVSCHEKFRPIEYKNLDKSSGGEKTSKISTPDAPPVPTAIKAEPPTAIVPEINKTITPEPPKPKPEPEKIIDVTEDKVPAQNTESFDIVYPDQLVLSCNGYDIRGEKVGDGEYEIRITSGGVFIANINSYGIVVGKHSRLKTEELNAANGSVSVAFDNFEKMNINLQQDPAPIANIAFGYTKLSVCVK